MKNLLATLSLVAGLAASAASDAQGFDFSGPNAHPEVELGTVQSVDLVQIERDIHAFDDRTLELRMQPNVTERLVIRLDAGDVVIVTVQGMQRFESGERVRVVSETHSPYGSRVDMSSGAKH
jgi:outer membrane lipoprotein SlyB